MTPQQIQDVQRTFKQVAPLGEVVAIMFYGRLFALDPELRTMFAENMTEQRRKLLAVLAIAVNGLDRVESLLPTLRDLGHRHVGYGVKPQHYDTVGAALLWTLDQGLGKHFTPEVREAWVAVYGALANTMLAGASEEAA